MGVWSDSRQAREADDRSWSVGAELGDSVALSMEMLGDEFVERRGFVKVLVASDL